MFSEHHDIHEYLENISREDLLNIERLSNCCFWLFLKQNLRELIERRSIDLYNDFICCGRNYPIILMPIDLLKPHEDIELERMRILEKDILERGILEKPILVEMNTFIILDGHHRYNIFRKIGKRKIPALLVDYNDPCVEVSSWRPEIRVSKDLVIKTVLENRLLPPKTSRHVLCFKIPEINLSINMIP